MTTVVIGVGCDLQAHEPVRAAWTSHGERYLRAVFSPLERCSGPTGVAGMALRFAVKESVAKALRVRADQPLPWHEISVLDVPPPTTAAVTASVAQARDWRVHLSGAARGYAQAAGITHWVIDAGGDDGCDTAIATVIALAGAKSSSQVMMETRRGDCTAVDTSCTVGLGGDEATVDDKPDDMPDHTPDEVPGRITANAPRLGETHMSQEHNDAVDEVVETIRQVVAQHAHLNTDAATLAGVDSLYAAGMTSHASVNVMLGVEDAFDIEFPEEMLTKETFESLNSIATAVAKLQDEQ